jgi:tetratricopeptide (TPR) repeat protein
LKFIAWTLLAWTAMAGTAAAQNPKAAAESLYNEGRQLVTDGKYQEACPKFEASQRLDPAPGTQLNLANCLEKVGKIASAWAEYKEAAAAAHAANELSRQDLAEKRAKELEADLSKLRVVASVDSMAGLEVRLDGVVVLSGMLNSDVAIDPGEHAVEAVAPGYKSYKTTVTVNPHADRKTVTIPALEPEPHVTSPTVTSPPVSPPTPSPEPKPASGWGAQRTAGVIVAGAGVVGVVVGAIFGTQALSKNSSAKPHCGGEPMQCDAEGVALNQDAKKAATISTVGFIAGGVLVAGGAVLFLTARHHSAATSSTALAVNLHPLVGAGTAGLGLGGTW